MSRRSLYLRFVTDEIDPYSNRAQGIFHPAYALVRGEHEVDACVVEGLRTLLRWFEEHLPLPPRHRIPDRAVFWFKAEGPATTANVWELVRLIEEEGRRVRLIKTVKPGRIVFEDDYQAAAVPFRDSMIAR
jgi:hypothetical protein